jgi:predicted metal-dependent hydrolase
MGEALFHYQLRTSPRARNVRLRVTAQRGLEVILPKGYAAEKVPALLQRKKSWIDAALERAERHRKFFESARSWRVPHHIRLPAIGKFWCVTTKKTKSPSVSVREIAPGCLLMSGPIDYERAARAALMRWLMRTTREQLVPRLQAISLKTGLHYHRAFVRRQKTRWASCSRQKSVSLNAKLLFLPADLVDYVITHELCHVAEMNHSKRFWRLVQCHCHGYRCLDKRLREMWKAVPRWASDNPA